MDLRRLVCAASVSLVAAASTCAASPKPLPAIHTVDYDRHGGFRVNGQPFFPIALYDAPLDERTLRELGEFGFNVLSCDAKSCASLPVRGFYGMVHASKRIDDLSGVFVGLGVDSPALHFKKDLLEQVADANQKTSTLVPGRPIMNAIGYWVNEPSGVMQGALPPKALYEDLVAAIDVSAPYLYPVPYQPVSSVGSAVARAVQASGRTKPVVPILQLFVWDAKDRYPTPVELRCMAFLALVAGGHGIGYYSYGSVTGRPRTTIAESQPELWKSVKALNHEIRDIGPRLLAGREVGEPALGEGIGAVRMKAVAEKDGVLAVVVNSSTTRQDVKLIWRDGNNRLLARDGRQIDIRDGVAVLRLESFAVEVVRWVK